MTQSDWINIAICAINVVTAVSCAVWGIMNTRPKTKPVSSIDINFKISVMIWYFRSAWPFLLGVLLGVVLIFESIWLSDSVTKSFVITLVAGITMLLLNLACAFCYLVVAVFRPTYLRLDAWASNFQRTLPSQIDTPSDASQRH